MTQPNFMWRRIMLWNRLASEGRHDVIAKLAMVEQRTPGFGTIAVPQEGFSDNDETHNAVLDFLREDMQVNVLNPSLEATRLERALKGAHHDQV